MSNENFQKMMSDYSQKYSKVCIDNNQIDASLFEEYGVKRGLRDKNGKGVLSGITNISLIKASDTKDGRVIPCVRSQCQNTLCQGIHNILAWRFHNNITHKIRRKPSIFSLLRRATRRMEG